MRFGKTVALTALVACSIGVRPASASLIYLGTYTQAGSGIGAVETILNIQGQGQNSSPGARITRNGAADLIETQPNTQTPGGANNQTRPFSAVGIDQGEEFRLVLNINESDNLLTVTGLQVGFYSPNNVLFHVAVLDFTTCNAAPNPTSCTFAEVGSGIGNSDHVFGLSASEATAINLGFASGMRVGIGSPSAFTTHSGDSGGFDSYFLARVAQPGDSQNPFPSNPVPEPGSLLLLGGGLVGMAAKLRRRFGL